MMRLPNAKSLSHAARRSRTSVLLALKALARLRRPLAGRFQPYSHTLPDRYPWLFRFAFNELGQRDSLNLLSFGCSRGDEVFTLHEYFAQATIKGIDVDPRNIAACRARTHSPLTTFAEAASTDAEPSESYDAIFCLAVLCLGDLTTSGAEHSDPYLRFEDFERTVAGFARCLKPGGLLLLHTTNFRFADTVVAADFEVVLEADPAQLAPDAIFDRNNRLLPGGRYLPVGFRKRSRA
jgi:SAM-dependent methyltransferase